MVKIDYKRYAYEGIERKLDLYQFTPNDKAEVLQMVIAYSNYLNSELKDKLHKRNVQITDLRGKVKSLLEACKWAFPYLQKLNVQKKTLGFGLGLSDFKKNMDKAEKH